MAVTRTVLPRKGFVQSQHGLTQYEADQDSNWVLLDTNVAFLSDLIQLDLNINGVVSGFTLSTSPNLTPGLTAGILYAQGQRYAPTSQPSLAPAPADVRTYLFYNSQTGFYYSTNSMGSTTGDAYIGTVVTNFTSVTQVAQATCIYGAVGFTAPAPGSFTQWHGLGRTPICAIIQMTSPGAVWFQTPVNYDGTFLYLVASDVGITGKVIVW
jgi:hypothetical protein